MISYPEMHPGIFLQRPNRFLAQVQMGEERVWCHVKNTGRCKELLVPGAAVWCQHHADPRRKTQWSLITVQRGDTLFNIDSQIPNRLALEWVCSGGLGVVPEDLRPEQRYGDARFDLKFSLDGRPCFLEVKGVTLEENGVARFPDAPTERGAKHLRHLRQAVGEGYGAYVLFVCQMQGVRQVEPHWEKDPAFARELVLAAEAGVQVLAVECHVTPESIEVAGQVPAVLER
jgi:sugar fermentation stimulation protein